jgi:hypothetical protein
MTGTRLCDRCWEVTSRGGVFPVDIAAIKWAKLDPRLGNYEDCNAAVIFDLASELVGARPARLGWHRIDSERVAFKVLGDDCEVVWIVTVDHDADGDSDGWRDRSTATRVEVIRC